MPTVSEEQFCLILDYCKDYERFHSVACQLAHDLIFQRRFSELTDLEKAIEIVGSKYKTGAHIYILEHISMYLAFLFHNCAKNERDYQSDIVHKFDTIFPELELVSSERKIPGSSYRADILAKEKNSGRDVIIELKVKRNNPTPQLRKYSKYFKNPLLIGITEECLKDSEREKGIMYYTYADLGL